jgi:RNA polymerase sigma-70 factor (ECF subfamily)
VDPSTHGDEFVVLITGVQAKLYAYVLSLLGDPHQAADVLQETNLVLWRKANEYTPGTDFTAWAYRVAHFQVLAQRQKLGREKLVFDDLLLADLNANAAQRSDTFDSRLATLYDCMKKLSERQRNLFDRHYADGQSIGEMAAARGETAGAITQAIFRARVSLLKCIENEMKRGAD